MIVQLFNKPLLRYPARFARACLVGCFSLWLATVICPSTSGHIGPGGSIPVSVGISFSLHHGGTISVSGSSIPLIMRFHSFTGPLAVYASLTRGWITSLNAGQFAQMDASNALSGILPVVLWHAVLLVILTVGLILAINQLSRLPISKRRWRFRGPALAACTMAVTCTLVAAASFDIGTLRRPSITGDLTVGASRINSLWGRADLELRPLTLSVLKTQDAAGVVRVLHVSDFHLNPVGFQLARRWAKELSADFVLDTGDTTSFGQTSEYYLVAPEIQKFGIPYLFVHGNHDNPAVEQLLAKLPNVHVLDNSEYTIDGLTIYGLGDPSFTPLRELSNAVQACQASEGVPIIEKALDHLPTPDILAVHDKRMALGELTAKGPGCYQTSNVPGRVPLIVAGHLHHQFASSAGSTLVLNTGTAGAGGYEAFDPGNQTPYSADLLTFAPDANGHMELVAYDVISQQHDGPKIDPTTSLDHFAAVEQWFKNETVLSAKS